jgi:mersacidin/lichenicidin family type 2 lantibiotic
METVEVIRAWKDPLYRSTLSAGELDQLPVHPAGLIELQDEQLKQIYGMAFTTAPTCTEYTFVNYRRCCPKFRNPTKEVAS